MARIKSIFGVGMLFSRARAACGRRHHGENVMASIDGACVVCGRGIFARPSNWVRAKKITPKAPAPMAVRPGNNMSPSMQWL